jgi:hypothetical protein
MFKNTYAEVDLEKEIDIRETTYNESTYSAFTVGILTLVTGDGGEERKVI